MTTIEHKIRDLSDKWKSANREASDICRDAAEELRVLRIQLDAANKELKIYRSISESKIYQMIDPPIPGKTVVPYCMHSSQASISGWGKGKDE